MLTMKVWSQWPLRPLRMLSILVNLGFVFNLDSTDMLLALSIMAQTTPLPIIICLLCLWCLGGAGPKEKETVCLWASCECRCGALCIPEPHHVNFGMFTKLGAPGSRWWANGWGACELWKKWSQENLGEEWGKGKKVGRRDPIWGSGDDARHRVCPT